MRESHTSEEMFNSPPSRYSGDANNPAGPVFWATWDFPNRRSISVSIYPDGRTKGTGWTREPTRFEVAVAALTPPPVIHEPRRIFVGYVDLDDASKRALWEWGTMRGSFAPR
jgi:hypothetical protein